MCWSGVIQARPSASSSRIQSESTNSQVSQPIVQSHETVCCHNWDQPMSYSASRLESQSLSVDQPVITASQPSHFSHVWLGVIPTWELWLIPDYISSFELLLSLWLYIIIADRRGWTGSEFQGRATISPHEPGDDMSTTLCLYLNLSPTMHVCVFMCEAS